MYTGGAESCRILVQTWAAGRPASAPVHVLPPSVVWRRPKGADSLEPEAASPEAASPERPEARAPEAEPEASARRAGDAPEAERVDEPVPPGADDPAAVAAEPSATGWPEETGPEPDERVGPERLRPDESDDDWPDTPTDPSLRIPD